MGLKYIKKYENYKSSSKFGDEITEKEFNKLLHKNCKNYKNQEIKLYRGIFKDLKDFYYQNPKGFIRHSIEPQNIHVTIMSESDKWKKFPLYNQSIIGTTDKYTASLYRGSKDGLFEIIPYDNTKIGICPNESIWDVFGGFYFKTDIFKINIINVVDTFLRYYLNSENIFYYEWKIIKNKIYKINPSIRLKQLEKYKNSDYFHFIDNLMKKEKISNIKDITSKNIIEYIEYLFDPKINNFKCFKYNSNFSKNMLNFYKKLKLNNLQVWCEGPVLLKKTKRN